MTKILVIEDETPIRENVMEILEMEGFEVLGAADGRHGLEMAVRLKPDLILCDITMPELDGYEVLVEVRRAPETAATPFIFLTARTDRPFVRHGMELGADDYITKPFTPAEIRAAVMSRLDRHKAMAKSSDEDLAQARRTLIRMVSHELRTPLISINTSAEIISRQLGQLNPTQLQDMMDALNRGGKRLNRVVEQIVLTAELDTGALSANAIHQYGAVVPLAEVLIASIDLARAFAYRHPDVTIRLDERDTESEVLCDMRALKHGLAELITNALSFSPPTGEVAIAQWQAGDRVWLSIVDHGVGMAPDQVEVALKDFHQVDRDRHEQQGMGLGLPLARRIILTHGGDMEISSVQGKGTQITLNLPVYDGE
jgi:two-component system, sensor histidine kinase and response regulator